MAEHQDRELRSQRGMTSPPNSFIVLCMSPDEEVRKVVLVGGGHTHVQLLKDFENFPLPNADLTMLVDKPMAVYSGMVPGFVAGQYRAEELQINVKLLTETAGATLVAGRAVRVDRAAAQILTRRRLLRFL